ncbi:hypothetical protein MLD38_029877 [Melastoma candidum]|uniref:Uncharacterized protein n=1 Tax=Melastoma candidum TaxID=119954 RepID=A0ACB9N6R8_9MYRT|nr:hypothetical protein MLD38_029877 [Melastoma candidum]
MNSLSTVSFSSKPPNPVPCGSSSSSSSLPNNRCLSFPHLVKSACLSLSVSAAILLLRRPPLSLASPPPPLVEQDLRQDSTFLDQDAGDELPNDVDSLRTTMEERIKSRDILGAIRVVEKMMAVEPEEPEWPLLRCNLLAYSGDFESAKRGFEELLSVDPFRVEAYHGLVMASSESGEELKSLLGRIQDAMNRCRKEGRKSQVRDFKLLIGQVKVVDGRYDEALKVYEELVREEPRDFRPYLCQGIIHTLLRNKDEAEKKFKQYRKLVPKNHPYAEYFDDTMFATKFFGAKVERESAGQAS